MANPKVKFKRSSVANKRPTLSNLELGELALNTYDGKLFTRQDTGGIGIGTTVTLVNPWDESYGGESITYAGIQTSGGVTTTDYSTVTLSGLTPTGFNTTYTRQSTGFVLDTGTVASGNALFDTDSNHYYYVDSGDNSRILIFSESDNNWMGVASTSASATTEYNVLTTSNLSPTSFNQTYVRQATGFVLDTGTISSGNALFKADSNYYYYVASTGSSAEDRIVIYSEEDGGWMTLFDFNDPDFREGNISDNQAVGSSGIFSAALTTNSDTFNGRNVPDADSSNVTYDTTRDYTSLTLDAGISNFDGTYTRQSFKANLDTGSVSSGNALFNATSEYWWFLKDSDNSKMIIFDTVTSQWTYVGRTGADFSSAADNTAVGSANMVESQTITSVAYESSAYQPDANYSEITYDALSGTNFSEGNLTNNQAVGSAVTFVTVTSGKTTADSRSVPTASGSIVYGTSTSAVTSTRVGVVTITKAGDLEIAGIVTASDGFVGDITGNVTGNVTGNLTGTVLTASQTNITSVGTLGSLDVTNNITVGGTVDGRDVLDDGQAGDNLVTLSGVSRDSTDLGTFTGTTISDNGTIKDALQELETSLDNVVGGNSGAASVLTQSDSTDASFFPTFVADNNGSAAQENFKTDAGISYNPSTNILTVSGSVAANVTGNLTGNVTGNVTGNAGTATSLATARTIAGVSFDGTSNISLNNNAIANGAGYITTSFTNTNQLTNGAGFITVPVTVSTSAPSSPSTGDLWFDPDYGRTVIYYNDGNSSQWIDASPVATTISSATNLVVTGICTATGFSGPLTGNVTGNLTGNVTGNVTGDLTGNADTATQLETARSIGGVSFDGTADINLPGVNAAGNQNTSGTAAGLSGSPNITVTDIDGTQSIISGVSTATGGFVGNLTGNVTGNVTGDLTGNADTATQLATARTIAGVSFDGTSNISLNNSNITNGAGYITTSFTNTNQLTNGAGFITASDNISGTAAGLSGSPSITVTDITATGNVSIAGTLTYEDVNNVDSVGLVTARTGVRVTTGGLEISGGGAAITGLTTVTGNISVSGTVDGRDIATDGSKLDGIEANATADQTASEILTAIKTVDGASSGLDADVLDGQEGTYYLNYNNFTNTPTIPTNNNELTNGASYITASDNITGTSAGLSGSPNITVTNVTAGIVTATGGFNLGISSAGTTITSGPITTLNFVGTGNTFALNGTTVDVSISGGGSVSISTNAPSSPSAGDLWFNENYGRTLIYYDDGSSQQWIDASPVATTISSATNLQVTGVCTATTFDGNLELDQAAVESVTSTKTSTSEDSVDSFAVATYRSVTYDIQITRGSSYHTTTIKVLHDGTDTYMTEYGTMNTGSSLATFSSDISGGNVRLLATPSSATSTVFKIVKTLIKV